MRKILAVLFTLITILALINGSLMSQCNVPSLVSATPAQLCAPGGTTNLIATSNVGTSIAWYTVATGGTSLGNVPTGTNFNVSASTTTTYYAEAFTTVASSITLNYTGSA